jgi:hypothetical protein
MADKIIVRFEGLAALDRALKRCDLNLRAGLRAELIDAADVVAQEAQSIASSKGLRQSGDLIRKIRAFAGVGRAGVRSTAVHRGFAYPRRLEFEGRGGSTYGPRATLLPALEAKTDEVEAKAEGLLDKFANDFGSAVLSRDTAHPSPTR